MSILWSRAVKQKFVLNTNKAKCKKKINFFFSSETTVELPLVWQNIGRESRDPDFMIQTSVKGDCMRRIYKLYVAV